MSEEPTDTPGGQQATTSPVAEPASTAEVVQDSSDALWSSLRLAREARGLTIAEVAHHLKFTPKQVEAMETGALKQLPGPAFTRGFVRNYARFLQLDVRPFMAALEPANEDTSLQPPPPRLGSMPSSRALERFPALPALAATLGLLALVVAGWYFSWFEPRDEAFLADIVAQSDASVVSAPIAMSAPLAVPQAPQVAVSTTTASAPLKTPQSAPSASVALKTDVIPSAGQSELVATTDATAKSADGASVPQPIGGRRRLILDFDGDAWVEVRDGTGRIIFSRLNEAGSKQEVQGVTPLSLVIGNAQEVHLSYNGKAVDLTPHIKVNVAHLTLQ